MSASGGSAFEVLQRRFRAKRFQYVERIIRQLLENRDTISILDAGGRAQYWLMLPEDLRSRVRITILNYGTELATYDVDRSLGFDLVNVTGNACDMPEFADGSFDLVHSNSVIEHVGSYENMMRFADEVRRVGRAYYVQTPNYWFPIDPHYAVPFVHWLPDPVRAFLFSSMNVGRARKSDYRGALIRMDRCRMVSRRLIASLFTDGRLSAERFLLIFEKSIIATRAP